MTTNLMNRSEVTTMSSKEIAELTGKQHGHVMRDIRTMFEQIDQSTFGLVKYKAENGEMRDMYELNYDDTMLLLTGYSVPLRKKVLDRWKELEEAQAPKMPQTYVEALEAHLKAVKAKEVAELERDYAIQTKAHISDKKTATAMNTASQAVKKVNKLEQELDQSKEYCTVKRMQLLTHGQKYNWRTLKEAAANLEIPSIDVFDQNYGTVKAYHKDVWLEAYAIDLNKLA